MTDFSLLTPDLRRAEIDYRIAKITRDYRSVRSDWPTWWQRRRRIRRDS